MAILLPTDLNIYEITNNDERRVVQQLIDDLDDRWWVIPNLSLHEETREREVDVILVHPDHGVGIVEVKGYSMTIRDGQWIGQARKENPQAQAMGNALSLRGKLRNQPYLPDLDVEWGIALPNCTGIKGHLPPGIVRDQLLLSGDLEDANQAVERLFQHRSYARQLSRAEIDIIITFLCPDAELLHDDQSYARRARERLDAISATQMETLRPLDRHRRVVVSGKAGTGKTFLATRWALRGNVDHDDGRPRRVLLTCYNEPLAAQLKAQMPESEDLVVGAFLTTALGFEGMPPLDTEEADDHRWWMVEAVSHLIQNWHRVTERFDRIIIDEAQDFSPAWLGLLEALLDPEGDTKLFLFVDSSQTVYERGFVMPRIEDGWIHAELQSNVRNTREIAHLARKVADGAPAPSSRPESSTIRGIEADSLQAAYVATHQELGRLHAEGLDPLEILVVTTTSAVRDYLRTNLGLTAWEFRDGESIACETAHRAKGLEASAVIVVEISEMPDPTHLYVGITRAVNQLSVIGPLGLLEKLGLR